MTPHEENTKFNRQMDTMNQLKEIINSICDNNTSDHHAIIIDLVTNSSNFICAIDYMIDLAWKYEELQ